MASAGARRRRRVRPVAYVWFYLLFASILVLVHLPLLRLPYFWDELGQFVPAAVDIYRHASLIPTSAVPNSHPPGVMLYVAAAWRIFGESIPVARVAMLLLASAGVLFAFLLAILLSRETRGAPAFVASALLIACPWFYAQAMFVQLDMPAMVLSALALLLFLQNRIRAAAAACVALVLVKETGAIVPALFLVWLWFESRRREAAWFLIPLAGLSAWLLYLHQSTGHLFGSEQFTEYNLFYSLHPARLVLALLRRLYMLLVGGFHWIGTAALLFALVRTRLFTSRSWQVAGAFAAVHVLAFTVTGGAVLERYLLPVLPVAYAAMACAFTALPGWWRTAAPVAALVGVVSANFIVPPYPYPLENNLAFVDFVELQRTAAGFLEVSYPDARIATVWPFDSALRRPYLGYVQRRFAVRPLPRIEVTSQIAPDEALVVFSFDRQNSWRLPLADLYQTIRRSAYGARDPLPPLALANRLQLVASWSRGGHWIEIYRPPMPDQ